MSGCHVAAVPRVAGREWIGTMQFRSKEAEIWATLAKYHGKFDRVYRRRDDAKLMGLTDRTKAFVREYCSKHPSARIQQPASGPRLVSGGFDG